MGMMKSTGVIPAHREEFRDQTAGKTWLWWDKSVLNKHIYKEKYVYIYHL